MKSTKMQRNAAHFNKMQSNAVKLGSDRIPISEKTGYHTITIKEAVEFFKRANAGLSLTTIWRMCQKDKNGNSRLDGIKDPALTKILITQESLDTAIAEESYKRSKQETPTSVKPPASPGEPTTQASPDASESQPAQFIIEKRELEKKLANANAIIDANDKLVVQMEKQIKEVTEMFAQRLENLATEKGILETKLKQIEAPKERQGVKEQKIIEVEASHTQEPEINTDN